MHALRRADHLCLVVDGEKLLDEEKRHIARNDARSILRSVLEAGSLSPTCEIDVVFSKWDLVSFAIQSGKTDSFIAETRDVLTTDRRHFETIRPWLFGRLRASRLSHRDATAIVQPSGRRDPGFYRHRLRRGRRPAPPPPRRMDE